MYYVLCIGTGIAICITTYCTILKFEFSGNLEHEWMNCIKWPKKTQDAGTWCLLIQKKYAIGAPDTCSRAVKLFGKCITTYTWNTPLLDTTINTEYDKNDIVIRGWNEPQFTDIPVIWCRLNYGSRFKGFFSRFTQTIESINVKLSDKTECCLEDIMTAKKSYTIWCYKLFEQ